MPLWTVATHSFERKDRGRSFLTLVGLHNSVHFDEQTGNRTILPGAEENAENQPEALGGTGGGGRAHDFELGDGERELHGGDLAEGGAGAGVCGEGRDMKRGIVYCCDRLAGELVEDGGKFVFRYAPEYLAQPSWPAVSATWPPRAGEYGAEHLFPFFTGCSPKARKRNGSAASCTSTRTMPFRGSWTRVTTGRSCGGGRGSGGREDGVRTLPFKAEDLIGEAGAYSERTRRSSVSRVQDKVQLLRKRRGYKVVESRGTYILKPVPRSGCLRLAGDVPPNESLTMDIAQRVFRIQVSQHELVRLADGELAYLTERFDRQNGQKILHEDFCQALVRPGGLLLLIVGLLLYAGGACWGRSEVRCGRTGWNMRCICRRGCATTPSLRRMRRLRGLGWQCRRGPDARERGKEANNQLRGWIRGDSECANPELGGPIDWKTPKRKTVQKFPEFLPLAVV